MLGVHVLFWIFVAQFAIIGFMRGWAKEILVSFAVMLGLFLITLLEKYGTFLTGLFNSPGSGLFWMKSIITMALVFFGYQTPNLPSLSTTSKFNRDRFQDMLLGFFLGGINGYLIFGSIWSFMAEAGYPFPDIISNPATTNFAETTSRLLELMPPVVLGEPAIYFAVAISLAFILVVFL